MCRLKVGPTYMKALCFHEQLGPKKKQNQKSNQKKFEQLGREKANSGENLRTQARICELGQNLFFWLFGFEFWISFEISFGCFLEPCWAHFLDLSQLMTSVCRFWLPASVRVGWVLRAEPGRLRLWQEAWNLSGTTACRLKAILIKKRLNRSWRGFKSPIWTVRIQTWNHYGTFQ